MRTGQLVLDRRRTKIKTGIVVGPSSRAGKVRVCYWRNADVYWSAPIAIDEARLEALDDPTALALIEAKHLVAAAFERDYLMRVMKRARDSVSEAARLADVDRTNFRRLLQRHGLHRGRRK